MPYAAGEIHTGNRQLGADEQIASNVICRQLQRAKADRSVRAVVLRIDSPGSHILHFAMYLLARLSY